MGEVAMLVGAMLFPVLGLALILWLTHLEETLAVAVSSAARRPPPAPILAIPVHRHDPVRTLPLPAQHVDPEQRTDPAVAV